MLTVEANLNKILMQECVFSLQLSWTEMVEYRTFSGAYSKKIKFGIIRNHSFEFCANAIDLFSKYTNVMVEYEYGDYDDHLAPLQQEVNVNILWVDCRRYSFFDDKKKLISFLFE